MKLFKIEQIYFQSVIVFPIANQQRSHNIGLLA